MSTDAEGNMSWVSPSPELETEWNAETSFSSRLMHEYYKWIKRGNEDVLPSQRAFIAGWMAYARIAGKEWPRKV
jgi:hypothetical protein